MTLRRQPRALDSVATALCAASSKVARVSPNSAALTRRATAHRNPLYRWGSIAASVKASTRTSSERRPSASAAEPVAPAGEILSTLD